MAQIPINRRVQTLINKSLCMIHLNTLPSHKCCVRKGNSYKCICNKISSKNNCPRLFSANFSLCVFSLTPKKGLHWHKLLVHLALKVMYGNINRQKEVSSNADLLWHALYSGRSFLCSDLIYSSDSTLIERVREEEIQRKRERFLDLPRLDEACHIHKWCHCLSKKISLKSPKCAHVTPDTDQTQCGFLLWIYPRIEFSR